MWKLSVTDRNIVFGVNIFKCSVWNSQTPRIDSTGVECVRNNTNTIILTRIWNRQVDRCICSMHRTHRWMLANRCTPMPSHHDFELINLYNNIYSHLDFASNRVIAYRLLWSSLPHTLVWIRSSVTALDVRVFFYFSFLWTKQLCFKREAYLNWKR